MLYSLQCAGRPVAMHFGLMRSGQYRLLKTAYDESLHDCSPGQLLTHEVLLDLDRCGSVEFDFLGPSMEWKRAWPTRLRPHADWYVLRGPLGRLASSCRFGLRPALGRAVRRWRGRTAMSS
jgi:CelD/BcsL family acetyltransferase involved in cellulose biosynthesis